MSHFSICQSNHIILCAFYTVECITASFVPDTCKYNWKSVCFGNYHNFSHNEAFQVYCHLAQDDSQMLHKFEVFLEETVQKIKEQSKAKAALETAFDQ